jgi:hypothetical protein
VVSKLLAGTKSTAAARKEWIVSKKLPPRFERVLKKLFIEPSRGTIRRLREDVPPQTAMRRMEAAVLRAGARLPKADLDAFVPDLMEMIRTAPEKEIQIDVPAAKSEAETAVFSVLDALDRALPYGTIALLTMMVGVGRPAHFATRYETIRLGRRVENARGEERALQLKEFAWHVLENEHVPFLHVLLQSAWIANGKTYRAGNSIGDWVNEVRQQGLLGELLWLDAPRVRNAVSHRLGWRPSIDRGTVVLHDKRKFGAEPWTQEFEVDDLFERLTDLVKMSHTFDEALHRAFTRDFFIPMHEPFIRAIRTGTDDPALTTLGEAFFERLLHARDRMFELGWTLAL